MKDLPGLKEIAYAIRNDTLTFFDIHDLKPNEVLLKKENPGSIYILVSGTIKKSIYAPWTSYKVHIVSLIHINRKMKIKRNWI